MRLLFVPAAAAVAGLSCQAAPTQLVVHVHTDFPEGELDGFGVRVIGLPDGEPHERGVFPTTGEGRVTMPASFGVAPAGDDADRRVEVEVDAIADDDVLFTTRARTGFVEHEPLRLDLFLARRCRQEALDCPDGQTCTIDGCAPIDVPVEDLRPANEPPAPPPVSVDWTLWGDAATPAGLDVDESGAAFVGLRFEAAPSIELEGVALPIDPAPGVVIARVDTDGTSPWNLTLRSPGELPVGINSIAAGEGAVWLTGSALGGIVVEHDGVVSHEDPTPALFLVMRLSPDGDLEGLATASEGLQSSGQAVWDGEVLGVGGVSSTAGRFIDGEWSPSGAQGILLRIAGDLTTAQACLWDESPSVVVGVASIGEGLVMAGAGNGLPIVRATAPDCANSWQASLDFLGSSVAVASAPARPVSLLTMTAGAELAIRQLDSASGAELRQRPLLVDGGWSSLGIRMDPAGRLLAIGMSTAAVEYDSLRSERDGAAAYAGFILGTGPALEGRWIRRLETDSNAAVQVVAPDPHGGAVVFMGTGSGSFSFGGDDVGTRAGGSVLVRRFVP